jgi:hypothetical protein
LQRLSYNFPSGSPGIGLLALRVALAASLAADAGPLIATFRDADRGPDGTALLLACLLLAGAASAATGFLTGLVQTTVALAVLATLGRQIVTAVVTASPPSGSWHVSLLEMALAAALALIGPGAYSIDARLFGRQEIVIPPSIAPPFR